MMVMSYLEIQNMPKITVRIHSFSSSLYYHRPSDLSRIYISDPHQSAGFVTLSLFPTLFKRKLISFMDTVIAKFATRQLCQCHNTLQTHQELWRSGC